MCSLPHPSRCADADDVHYQGGSVLASEMLSWASIMWAWNARPPSQHVVGRNWHRVWLQRLRRMSPWVNRWLAHQHRDDYWRHGSVACNIDRVDVPVYLIGGWVVRHEPCATVQRAKLNTHGAAGWVQQCRFARYCTAAQPTQQGAYWAVVTPVARRSPSWPANRLSAGLSSLLGRAFARW